jgi:hypothetical protein
MGVGAAIAQCSLGIPAALGVPRAEEHDHSALAELPGRGEADSRPGETGEAGPAVPPSPRRGGASWMT